MAAKKAKRPPVRKMTSAELARQVSAVSKAIETHRRANKGEFFQALSPDEIEEKLKRVNTPFISSMGYATTTPGGSFALSVGVFNPDPVNAGSMHVHVYAGPAHVITDIATALLSVDTRFNRLTEPPGGLFLGPGASSVLLYSFRVPAGIDRSRYMVNCVLMRHLAFNEGSVLDRSYFAFQVV